MAAVLNLMPFPRIFMAESKILLSTSFVAVD
jgi:hypothetical protein